MFSLSNLNLDHKKNSEIILCDHQIGSHYSIICLFESSSSSDTGCLTLIQQNNNNGYIQVRKLIWISDSIVSALTINPSCDWLAVSIRGGSIAILPVGSLMGRVQKKCENWKSTDVTYLTTKLKPNFKVTCMKWWTTYKNKSLCLIGSKDGALEIIDLTNGNSLYSEMFPDYIYKIDLLHSIDAQFTYCIITTKVLNQWKLLLEEGMGNEPIFDLEFGFESIDFPTNRISSIITSKGNKKTKGEQLLNEAYLPSKMYQFPQSTYLQSQFFSGKYFLGAYDRITGKYKLFECTNLENSLFEYQLPIGVIHITVTEDLLYLIINCSNTQNGEPTDEHPSQSDYPIRSMDFSSTTNQKLKLIILLRQYSHSHLHTHRGMSGHHHSNTRRTVHSDKSMLYKQLVPTILPKSMTKSLLFEFNIPNLYLTDEILSCVNLSQYFNFNKSLSSTFSPIKTSKFSTIQSKWGFSHPKTINPFIVVGSSGVSVCHLSECLEDKFIDLLLSDNIKQAEELGVGLRLDMNELYEYTALLLATGRVTLNESVTRSTKSLIIEFLEMASAKMNIKVKCLIQYLPLDACLQQLLSWLPQINKMNPTDRTFLSNTIILLFGKVMSEPIISHNFNNSSNLNQSSRNLYADKFWRFVTNNCYFNELKSAKILIQFGLIDEAFHVAKEKGCVLELFSYLMENKYSTNWPIKLDQKQLQTHFTMEDQDMVLRRIGLMELEIIARADPRLIRFLAEFIIKDIQIRTTQYNNTTTDLDSIPTITIPHRQFSFRTLTHLCTIFNPFGSLLDTIYRILTSTSTLDTNQTTNAPTTNMSLFQSIYSNNSISTLFSNTSMKLKKELGSSLLAYCLTVIIRHNMLSANSTQHEYDQYSYFIHIYNRLLATLRTTPDESDNESDSTQSDETIQPNNLASLEAMRSTIKESSLDQILHLITRSHSHRHSNTRKSINYHQLPLLWQQILDQSKRLIDYRDKLLICVSIFDVDLFDDEDYQVFAEMNYDSKSGKLANKSSGYFRKTGSLKSPKSMSRSKTKCQINMLGFNTTTSNSSNNTRSVLGKKNSSDQYRILLLPKELESGQEIIRQVVLGKEHVLILSGSRSVVYGAGTSRYGQLLMRSEELSHRSKNSGSINIVHPVPLDMPLEHNEHIISLSSGDYHCGAVILQLSPSYSNVVDNEESEPLSWISRIMTWGWNAHGQLGIGSSDDAYEPSPVFINSPDRGEYPIQLEMGCYHSIILTNQGNVFSCGNNTFGQLGVKELQKSVIPCKVEEISDVTMIATRYFHTSCCTEDNQIYTWGIQPALWLNKAHQCKSHDTVSKPTRVEGDTILQNQKIVKMSCGSNHTVLITDKKLTYSFGSNFYGQLGIGNRKETNKLVEVSLSKLPDYIVSEDGTSISMSSTNKATFLHMWGKSSHPILMENMRYTIGDTASPIPLIEYPHVQKSHSSNQNCFGMDTINGGHSTILTKQQLMIVFLNFSEYLDKSKLISMLSSMKEVDIIADYFLMNDMIVQSFFWRLKSVATRIKEVVQDPVRLENLSEDVELIFKFYIRLLENEKFQQHKKSLISMMVGFFKRQNCLWNVLETLMRGLLEDHVFLLANLFIVHGLEQYVSGIFLRDLLCCLACNKDIKRKEDCTITSKLPSLKLSSLNTGYLQRLVIKRNSGNIETSESSTDSSSIFETADEHRVVQFASCDHAYQLARFKSIQVPQFIDQLRKRTSTPFSSITSRSHHHFSDDNQSSSSYSTQAVNRIYSDSTVLPECLECLSNALF